MVIIENYVNVLHVIKLVSIIIIISIKLSVKLEFNF